LVIKKNNITFAAFLSNKQLFFYFVMEENKRLETPGNAGVARERDFLDIMEKIGDFFAIIGKLIGVLFKNIAKLFGVILVWILHKIIWFVLFMSVAVAVGVLFYKTQRLTYRVTLTASMIIMDNLTAVDFINKLGSSAIPGDKAWTRLLNLPDTSYAQYIESVGAYWGVDYNQDGVMDVIDIDNRYNVARKVDTLPDEIQILRDKFYIVAKIYDKRVLPYIGRGIVDKISNNAYIKRQNEIQRASMQARLTAVNYQAKMLDSLQRYEYFTRLKESGKQSNNLIMQANGQMIEFTEKDQRLLHKEALLLQEERINLEARLARPDVIKIIELGELEGFEHDEDMGEMGELDSKLSDYLMQVALIAFLFAAALGLIWDYRRWLRNNIGSMSKKK
jgi:hypothetical protein